MTAKSLTSVTVFSDSLGGRGSLGLQFVLSGFTGKVFAAELDDVGRIASDDLLGEVLEDLG